MAKIKMVSADQFLHFLKGEGGSASRADILRRWRNGNMTSTHLNQLVADTGCVVIEEASTGGRPKTVVCHPNPKAVAP